MDEPGGARSLAGGPLTPADLGLDDAIAEFERRAAERPVLGRPAWMRWVVGVLLTLVLVSLITYDFVLHDAFHGGLLDGATANGVYDACNGFVTQRLERGSEASFASFDAAAITVDGRYGTDFAYVDSTGRSGARARRPFTCEVRYDGDGKWELTHLDLTTS